jgi:hypothetical protein
MRLKGGLRGKQAPKTSALGSGMPWGFTSSVPSPTGNLDPDIPCVLGQPTELKPGWIRLAVRPTAWTGAACTKGHRYTCTTLCHSWEATKRGRGIRQHATSSLLLASSRVNTGEPARDGKEGGEEAGGNPDETPRPHRQSNGAEESERGKAASRAKALRKRVGKTVQR